MNFANWKTTTAGLATIFAAIAHGFTSLSGGDFNTLWLDVMGVAAGVQGLVAKDHNVTGGDVRQ